MQTHNTYHCDMAGAIVLLIHPMLPMAPQVAGTDLERKRHCQEALFSDLFQFQGISHHTNFDHFRRNGIFQQPRRITTIVA